MDRLIAFIRKHIITTAIIAAIITILYALLTVEGYNYFIGKGNKEKRTTVEELLETEDWSNDGCKSDADCKSCKRDIKCLQCMHDCYNRYAEYTDRENPFRKKAIICNKECWDKIFWESPDIDFGIPPIKKGK